MAEKENISIKPHLLDVVKYRSADYKERNGAEKVMRGVVMGLQKYPENIISSKYQCLTISEEKEEIYQDLISLDNILHLEKTGLDEDIKKSTHIGEWPENNKVFRFDDDYGILISTSMSADTKMMHLKFYSMDNCPLISKKIYDAIDEVFLKKFKGFDDPMLCNNLLMNFRTKHLSHAIDSAARRSDADKMFYEREEIKIYSVDLPIAQIVE